MILIKDRHRVKRIDTYDVGVSNNSTSINGKYDTYKGSTLEFVNACHHTVVGKYDTYKGSTQAKTLPHFLHRTWEI